MVESKAAGLRPDRVRADVGADPHEESIADMRPTPNNKFLKFFILRYCVSCHFVLGVKLDLWVLNKKIKGLNNCSILLFL